MLLRASWGFPYRFIAYLIAETANRQRAIHWPLGTLAIFLAILGCEKFLWKLLNAFRPRWLKNAFSYGKRKCSLLLSLISQVVLRLLLSAIFSYNREWGRSMLTRILYGVSENYESSLPITSIIVWVKETFVPSDPSHNSKKFSSLISSKQITNFWMLEKRLFSAHESFGIAIRPHTSNVLTKFEGDFLIFDDRKNAFHRHYPEGWRDMLGLISNLISFKNKYTLCVKIL